MNSALSCGSHILTLFGGNSNPLNLQNICAFYCVVFVGFSLCEFCRFVATVWLGSFGGITLRRFPGCPTVGNVAAVWPSVALGRAFSGSAVSEGCVSLKVSCKEVSCCCEFVAHETQSHQPGSHCELGVFALLWLGACCSQVLCHLAERQAKLNVALELSCVKAVFLFCCRFVELEKSEFNLILNLE